MKTSQVISTNKNVHGNSIEYKLFNKTGQEFKTFSANLFTQQLDRVTYSVCTNCQAAYVMKRKNQYLKIAHAVT